MNINMKHFLFLIPIILACSISQVENGPEDLKYFNIDGKVKSFSEIRVNLSCSKKDNFNLFDKVVQVNYHIFNFDSNGKLESIEDKNPAPYSLSGSSIKILRQEGELNVIQKSEKETYIQTFKISKDTLSYFKYNKIDDNHFDYHSEKFKQKKLIRHKDRYVLIQEDEGENENYIFTSNKYIVDFNEKGLESLMYKISGNDTIPYYEVNYLEFDLNGNWLQRQFKYLEEKSYDKCFTEYRRIEYYK